MRGVGDVELLELGEEELEGLLASRAGTRLSTEYVATHARSAGPGEVEVAADNEEAAHRVGENNVSVALEEPDQL